MTAPTLLSPHAPGGPGTGSVLTCNAATGELLHAHHSASLHAEVQAAPDAPAWLTPFGTVWPVSEKAARDLAAAGVPAVCERCGMP